MDIYQKQLRALQGALRAAPGDSELEFRQLQLLVAAGISEARALPAALEDLLPRRRVEELNRCLDDAEAVMCQGDPWHAHERLEGVIKLVQIYLDDEAAGGRPH